MKRRLRLRYRAGAATVFAALTSILTLSTTASAEPAPHARGVHAGIGAAIAPLGFNLIGDNVLYISPIHGGGLYFPIDIGSSFRVEPEVGIFRYSETTTAGDGNETTDSLSGLRLGTGLFYRAKLGQNGDAYVGPRLAVLLNKQVSEGFSSPSPGGAPSKETITRSRTDVLLTLSGGGEHFFTPYFSLGVEGQIGMQFLGDPTTEYDPAPPEPGSQSEQSSFILQTNALLFARVFFF